MPTKQIDCKLKGCKLIWACITDSGQIQPIGCVTAATLNSSEQEGENSAKFGGQLSDDQETPLRTTVRDGVTVLADGESRFELDGNFYDGCSATSSGCQDELNITVDYCFERDCEANTDGDANSQQKLACGSVQQIGLFRLNNTGSLTELWRGIDSKINSKNRTFATGQNTDHSFDLNITATETRYSACFH